MEFKQLEAFVNVVRYKSFSKAADASFLTQPTVSTHIKSLEKELGVTLIDRMGKESLPTSEGRELYRYAVNMLNTRQQAAEVIGGMEDSAALVAPDQPITGNVDNTIHFTGTLDHPEAVGYIHFYRGSYRGVLLSGMDGDYFIKDDVLRIRNGSFYSGPGDYTLFVIQNSKFKIQNNKEGNLLVPREVKLGECNYDYIEVISGLEPGEQVVVNDMSKYKGKEKIKVK